MDSKHIRPARRPRFLAIATLAFATAVLALLFSPVQAQEGDEVLQSVSEGDTDLPNDNATHGRVAVGGSATGNIGTPGDQDRFAVELQAGRTYRFDLTGSPGGGGTLRDTYFRAIYNSEGRYQSGQLQRRLRRRPRQPGDVHAHGERDLLRAGVGRPGRDRDLHAERDRRDAGAGGGAARQALGPLRHGDPRLGGPHLGRPGRRQHHRLRHPAGACA